MDIIRTLQPGAIIFILIGVTFLGGAIGSFLNVVIYRLPLGKSLNRPSSHCPHCGHAIRPWHNIPVFGWLLLRGKCYDCGKPISPRYPLIEAIVAIMFLAIVWAEWFGLRSPMTFPLPEPTGKRIEPFFFYPSSFTILVTHTISHLTLFTTLLGVGMIEWDMKRVSNITCVPFSIWIPTFVASGAWWLASAIMYGDPDPSRLSWINNLVGICGINLLFGLAAGFFMVKIHELFNKLQNRESKSSAPYGLLFWGFLGIGLAMTFLGVILVAMFYSIVRVCETTVLWINPGKEREKWLSKSLPRILWLWLITLWTYWFLWFHADLFSAGSLT